jgi:hypothetical protein
MNVEYCFVHALPESCHDVIISWVMFMLIIPSEVYKFFANEFCGKALACQTESGDLYRLLPDGRIFVHWQQDGPQRYTPEGAYIGNWYKK